MCVCVRACVCVCVCVCVCDFKNIQKGKNTYFIFYKFISVAMMSDYDDSSDSSDLDSAGSAASYDPDHDLYTDVTDSDFTEGLIGEDRRTYQKTIRRKKKFLDKTRKTTVPILQRCEPHNRSSQKCEIVRVQQDGEGEGVICMLTCKVHSP